MLKFASIKTIAFTPEKYMADTGHSIYDEYPGIDPDYWKSSRYANIFIELHDENNKPVDGNYATVNIKEIFNGATSADVIPVTIIGSSLQIRENVLIEATNDIESYSYSLMVVGNVIENGDGTYTPPGHSDTTIIKVTIDKMESGIGAIDGQVTIVAISSAGNLQYSVNGADWQDSPSFSNLAGGSYIAYVRDVYDSIYQLAFMVDTVTNLLIADPSVTLSNGNISRWSAAFNPIVFTYQRRDFAVINIMPASYGEKTTFTINGILSNGTATIAAKDDVYINAGAYNGVYKVDAVDYTTASITIAQPYFAATLRSGFININKLRPYYQVSTQITYQDKLTNQIKSIKCTHRPNQTGLVKADVSSFLQSLLRAKDDSNPLQTNYRDDNLSASYQVSYAESWQDATSGKDGASTYVAIEHPYYVTYSAQQLGNIFGGNMAAYVPFKIVDAPSKRARWITDFAEPAYTAGYPFDIGFIYSEDLAGLNLYAQITPLDINRRPLADSLQTTYLLNEDSSFLLQQDSSKLIIYRQPVSSGTITTGVAQQIGLNRLQLNLDFSSQAYYFNVELKYVDGAGATQTVTQSQTIRIDKTGDDESVYLRWIGLTGSWNYYRFVHNQEISLDVQNAVIVKNHIFDWANQDALEDVISKSAGIKIKVMAEDLSVADIKGLQSIKFSPKVQMLVSKNPAKWQTVVINTATFTEYETRNGQAPFSITFNLPGLNVQTQ